MNIKLLVSAYCYDGGFVNKVIITMTKYLLIGIVGGIIWPDIPFFAIRSKVVKS